MFIKKIKSDNKFTSLLTSEPVESESEKPKVPTEQKEQPQIKDEQFANVFSQILQHTSQYLKRYGWKEFDTESIEKQTICRCRDCKYPAIIPSLGICLLHFQALATISNVGSNLKCSHLNYDPILVAIHLSNRLLTYLPHVHQSCRVLSLFTKAPCNRSIEDQDRGLCEKHLQEFNSAVYQQHQEQQNLQQVILQHLQQSNSSPSAKYECS